MALQTFISAKNDPAHVLHIELLVDIFSHLSILDVWNLRLVNKRWNIVLTSRVILGSVLTRWSTHDPADRSRSPDSVDEDTIDEQLRHGLAVHLGLPFSAVSFSGKTCPLTNSKAAQLRDTVAFDGHHLAYASWEDKTQCLVMLRDLMSGHVTRLHTPGRERVHRLTLSSKILAWTTLTGMLYVQRLATVQKEPDAYRLPSISIHTLVSHDGWVAMLYHDGSIALFTLETGSLSLISVPLHDIHFPGDITGLLPTSLLVDSEAKSIHLFGMNVLRTPCTATTPRYEDRNIHGRDCGNMLEIRHVTLAFEDGDAADNLIQRTQSSILIRNDHPDRFALGQLRGIGIRGLYNVQLDPIASYEYSHENVDIAETCVLFDTHEGKLRKETCHDYHTVSEHAYAPKWQSGNTIRWKDMFYSTQKEHDKPSYFTVTCATPALWPREQYYATVRSNQIQSLMRALDKPSEAKSPIVMNLIVVCRSSTTHSWSRLKRAIMTALRCMCSVSRRSWHRACCILPPKQAVEVYGTPVGCFDKTSRRATSSPGVLGWTAELRIPATQYRQNKCLPFLDVAARELDCVRPGEEYERLSYQVLGRMGADVEGNNGSTGICTHHSKAILIALCRTDYNSFQALKNARTAHVKSFRSS